MLLFLVLCSPHRAFACRLELARYNPSHKEISLEYQARAAAYKRRYSHAAPRFDAMIAAADEYMMQLNTLPKDEKIISAARNKVMLLLTELPQPLPGMEYVLGKTHSSAIHHRAYPSQSLPVARIIDDRGPFDRESYYVGMLKGRLPQSVRFVGGETYITAYVDNHMDNSTGSTKGENYLRFVVSKLSSHPEYYKADDFGTFPNDETWEIPALRPAAP